uniref:F-box/WD repeat-containing protein 7-like n=1 Tax=Geotrypetes seraphini TaxID=260995 RepID=A0A6P8S8I5_GEOSA|nr:F-box/WD repeat-containing protein 7-like [Geotrypetes seraphini]
MNQELLAVGSKRRRTGGSVQGNGTSSHLDEEQMNRVVEDDEQHQQIRLQGEEPVRRNGDGVGADMEPPEECASQQEPREENNNRFVAMDEESLGNQENEEEEEDMDQDSDDFDQSDDSGREDEDTNGNSFSNSSSILDLSIRRQISPFCTKTKNAVKMKKLDIIIIKVAVSMGSPVESGDLPTLRTDREQESHCQEEIPVGENIDIEKNPFFYTRETREVTLEASWDLVVDLAKSIKLQMVQLEYKVNTQETDIKNLS